jgi:methionine-S-sulfoxide reductase
MELLLGLAACVLIALLIVRFPAGQDPASTATPNTPPGAARAYFAAGCFWGVEHTFAGVDGVLDAVSGYMGGSLEQPGYREVCSGQTGHAETVEVTFDPARVSYRELLDVFFECHDPTQVDRQGPDVGSQYRSAIFAVDGAQLAEARAAVASLMESPSFRALHRGRPVATQVVAPGPRFWRAEESHQDYHAKHGGACGI